MKRLTWNLFVLESLLTAILLTSCIRNPATHKVNTRLLSAESERKIGEEAKKQILSEYHVLPSTTVSAYVDRVGQKLAMASDRPSVNYEFIVLDNDLINAFALPGGFIFVTRGLLENINDEDELTMVLGHEIAHVTALHGVQMIQKEMGQNALSILGTIGAAITLGPEAMLMVANTANLFSSLYLLGYTRDKEREADRYGLQYMLRAHYDPQASLRFLKKLEAGEDKHMQGWDLYFRTHPPTEERINIIESMIGSDVADIKPSQGTEFEKIKALLPKIDVVERGKILNHSYVNDFHHLRLRVPDNWDLGFIHPQALVSFRTKDAKAEGRLQVVKLSTFTPDATSLAREYAQYQGFKFVNGREVLYQAGYGYLGRYLGASPTGNALDIRLFSTIRNGRGYVLFAGAPMEDQEIYVLDLEQIIRNFKFSSS
ncbi:MAG: M48 family metalloprotease [Elusimicrobia bacterium]|nr:M48 family metalloprotease [Candidatus Obscuribacterium magneticum]